jgi:hypothetical protein
MRAPWRKGYRQRSYGAGILTVEWTFAPRSDGTTFVTVTNSGFSGDQESIAKQAIGATSGFTLVLAGMKALLEHGPAAARQFPGRAPRDATATPQTRACRHRGHAHGGGTRRLQPRYANRLARRPPAEANHTTSMQTSLAGRRELLPRRSPCWRSATPKWWKGLSRR